MRGILRHAQQYFGINNESTDPFALRRRIVHNAMCHDEKKGILSGAVLGEVLLTFILFSIRP